MFILLTSSCLLTFLNLLWRSHIDRLLTIFIGTMGSPPIKASLWPHTRKIEAQWHPSLLQVTYLQVWSVGPNNMGQIEVCREDKDSLERGIKGKGGGKRDIYNSINNHSLHPGSSEVVACFTLSQGKEAKKFTPPSPPPQKKKKKSLQLQVWYCH